MLPAVLRNKRLDLRHNLIGVIPRQTVTFVNIAGGDGGDDRLMFQNIGVRQARFEAGVVVEQQNAPPLIQQPRCGQRPGQRFGPHGIDRQPQRRNQRPTSAQRRSGEVQTSWASR